MKKLYAKYLTAAALALVLSACGNNNNNPNNTGWQLPGYGTNNGQYYQDTETMLVNNLQNSYGNITTYKAITSASNGQTYLAQGTHGWTAFISFVEQQAQLGNCLYSQSYSYQYIPTLARINTSCLYTRLKNVMNDRFAYDRKGSNFTLYHALDQVLSSYTYAYGASFHYWGQNWPYKVYYPQNGNSVNVGITYNGGNFGFNLGGSYTRW